MLDTQDKAPALKADDMGGSAITQAAGQQVRGPEASPSPARAPSSAAVAQRGFSGGGHDVPHRAEMEKSFGMDFGGVRAHTDAPAQAASRSLGAHAYALDNHVAFASTTPDKATVAHELTHTIQASGGGAPAGPAKKSAARDAAIDTSGEGEAERVEAAVSAGKPARSALEGGTAKQGSPRLKRGRGIARKESGSPMTFGMAFSPEGFEKQYWWNLWNAPEFEVPIPAVPGLNFKISPEVKVLAAGGVNWKEKALETQLKLEGIVGLGFSYGKSELAEVYAVMEANATGGFDYKYNSGGGEGEHALPEHGGEEHGAEHEHEEHAAEPGHAMVPAKKEAKRWELSGNIALSTNFAVGVELAKGWVDYRFEFGDCEIGKLTGLNWKDGQFDKSAVGWEWGEKPKEFFASMKQVLKKAEDLEKAGAHALKSGMDTAKRTGQAVYSGAKDVASWVSSW